MKATYHISEDDYAAALILGTRVTLRSFTRLGVLICVFVLGAFLIGEEAIAFISGAAGTVVIFLVLYFLLLRRFVVPASLRKHYRKYRLMQDPVSVELSDDGIEQTSEQFTTKLPWEYILGWRENDEFFLLAIAPRLYHILPKRIASDGFDFDLLRSRLEAAGKTQM